MFSRSLTTFDILRGTRNLSPVSIRFRLFGEKRKNGKINLIKFDEIEFKKGVKWKADIAKFHNKTYKEVIFKINTKM